MIKLNGKEVIFEQFPNGETLLKKPQLDINELDVNLVQFKYENDSDLIKLMILNSVLPFTTKKVLEIMYYPYSRMDRGSETITFTLQIVSAFIDALEFDEVIINEPHSNKCLELTYESMDKNTTADLFEEVKSDFEFDDDVDYILFPDKGAKERYKDSFKGYNTITAEKTRDFETGKITSLVINDEIPEGVKVAIVDDLSSYGGTFIWSASRLKEKSVGDIFLIVTHAEDTILDGKIPTDDLIKRVYCTNSIIDKSKETEKIRIKEII